MAPVTEVKLMIRINHAESPSMRMGISPKNEPAGNEISVIVPPMASNAGMLVKMEVIITEKVAK